MYKVHKELNDFYQDWVRLRDERTKLKENRDSNLAALKDGLKKLEKPFVFEKIDQGSYAMDTINKHPDKEYDIDVAVIFEKDDLPSTPADARKRIEKAMVEGGGNFKTPPEAKTNAVRVLYAEGHHVDLAVYRKQKDFLGQIVIEHAGAEWTSRNPQDITEWFTKSVQSKCPKKEYGSNVENLQLRRVVRLIKKFSKSRASWDLPGGLIITALVVECYVSNSDRDDVSLFETMKRVRDRLSWNTEVVNPANISQSLTTREKDKTRVKNLKEKLDFAVEKLNDLFDADCDALKAFKAWNEVFKHPYWKGKVGDTLKNSLVAGSLKVASNGNLISREGEKRIPVPPTRFYGE